MKYLVPQDLCSDVEEILLDTRRAVRVVLALDLRVGLVSVVEVYGAGHTITIARLRVSDRYTQVMISGTGLEYAESLVKGEATQERLLLPADREPQIEADFKGYTCRWEDIPSSKGETIALIVKTGLNANQQDVFQEVLERVRETFGKEESYHPLSEENIPPSTSGSEVKTFGMFAKITCFLRAFVSTMECSRWSSQLRLRTGETSNPISRSSGKRAGSFTVFMYPIELS